MDENTADSKRIEQLTRESLNAAWQEIELRPQGKRCKLAAPNYTEAANHLRQAEEALSDKKFGESLKYIVQARDAAAKARSSAGWITMVVALLLLFLLFAYLIGGFWGLLSQEPGGYCMFTTKASNGPETTLTVPVTTPIITATPYNWKRFLDDLFCGESHSGDSHTISGMNLPILLWGFLGGVVWCMYGLSRWYSRRLFDWHYLFWYILNPWIALVLGGMFSLTILSGLISSPSIKDGQTGSQALLYLVSFTVGLATHKFLKLLIRIITAIFGQVGPEEKSRTANK